MNLPSKITYAINKGLGLEAHGEQLKVRGPRYLVAKVLPLLKVHKPEILAYLYQAANDSQTIMAGAGEVTKAIREAVDERAAILEYDGGLPRCDAEIVAEFAQDYYRHLFSVARHTGCCNTHFGRYCDEGQQFRDRYYDATGKVEIQRERHTHGK
ncbi:MAG: hypothetical protein ACE5EH_13255 [Gammaproteobacteria bacterium]